MIRKLHRKIIRRSRQSPLFFLFILMLLPLTVFAVQRTINYLSSAQTSNSLNISFSPSTLSLPPNQTVKIIFNSSSSQIAFARISFTFDKSKVNLTSEITTNPGLSTTVQKSTMQQANSTGKATIVIAASPSDIKPSGSFEFASFSLKSLSIAANDNTVISIDTLDFQIVSSANQALNPQLGSLTISLTSPIPAFSQTFNDTFLPCQNKASSDCLNQWISEYSGKADTLSSDVNSDGTIDLADFEDIRRATYP